MPEQWFVRVEGKEYGPVDLAALHEWRAEGRLIASNEVRRVGDSAWIPASELGAVFTPAAIDVGEPPDPLVQQRSFPRIFADSFRVYRRGFLPFFVLALLVAIPSFVMKVNLAYVHTPENGVIPEGSFTPAVISLFALLLVLIAWPVFVAGLQFATADLLAGRPITTGDVLRRAWGIWGRMARLSIVVYGSYLFWTALPLLVIASIATSGPTVFSLVLAMFALVVQVYMAGRLFINFLFWQQSASIGAMEGVDALRDSKELARSRPDAPALQRPMYRGAILASIWLVVLLAISVAAEIPFTVIRLRDVASVDDIITLMQNLMNAPAPDTLTIASYAFSGFVHALVRPLLGISFVLLYFDAKARL